MKLHHLIIAIICTAIVCILATTLFYTTNLGEHRLAAEKLIEKLTRGTVTIKHRFSTPAGLQGFVIKPQSGSMTTVYTDRTGRYLITGSIINAKGQNQSQIDLQHYLNKTTAAPAYNAIAKTHWFLQGNANAPHKLYVVFDPNCIACHLLFESLQPIIAKGIVAVRWVPIAFLKPSSPNKAIAILSATDPVKAMLQNEANFNTSKEEGAIKPIANPTAGQKAQLAHNNAFAKAFQIFETPTILYRTAQGEFKLSAGFPMKKALQMQLITQAGSQF